MSRDVVTLWTNCKPEEGHTFVTVEPPKYETVKSLGFICPGLSKPVFLPKSQITVRVTQKVDPGDQKRWFVTVPDWLAKKRGCASLIENFGE